MTDHVWRVHGMFHPLNPKDDHCADIFSSLIRTPDMDPRSLSSVIAEKFGPGDPDLDELAVRYEITSIKYEGPLK